MANIFMAKIETEITNHRSLWGKSKKEVNTFTEQANRYQHTITFTAEIPDNETTSLLF